MIDCLRCDLIWKISYNYSFLDLSFCLHLAQILQPLKLEVRIFIMKVLLDLVRGFTILAACILEPVFDTLNKIWNQFPYTFSIYRSATHSKRYYILIPFSFLLIYQSKKMSVDGGSSSLSSMVKP